MGELLFVVDVVMLAAAVGLIIWPDKAYNWGRGSSQQKQEPPKNWHITGRLIGAVIALAAGVMLYIDLSAR